MEAKQFQVQTSPVKMQDVGGLDGICVAILKRLKHFAIPNLYRALDLSPVQSILLHGNGGVGKTLLAEAIAGELDIPLIKVSSVDLYSEKFGESEEKLRKVFELAVESNRCIIIIDNVERIFSIHEGDENYLTLRMVNQLIKCFKDLEESKNLGILVIGTAHKIEEVNSTLRSLKGFKTDFYIPMPDRKQRLEILNVLVRNVKIDPDVSLNSIAVQTDGFTGRELRSLVSNAACARIDRSFLKFLKITKGEGYVTGLSDELDLFKSFKLPEGDDCLEQEDFQKALDEWSSSS